jgi:hypothetical protein
MPALKPEMVEPLIKAGASCRVDAAVAPRFRPGESPGAGSSAAWRRAISPCRDSMRARALDASKAAPMSQSAAGRLSRRERPRPSGIEAALASCFGDLR